ncbi:MAG TPA: glycosyltransferase [Solirubrobacterales bacterium]|jgi:glycosyltransferase involved in cell wall biosynthesis/GT2 family glycosyltransferase|nr:glycosyltransferase [Solirubrobacterales bacterium]
MPTADSQVETAPPTISVVICAYTNERLELLAAGIEALGAQTVAPHEVVLVIDHAPELEAIARERWPEAVVLANGERQGLSGARNSGVAVAGGEVVAFLDDDASPAPNWIERLGAAYADPKVLGAGGTVRPKWETERPGWFPPEFDWVVGCTHSGMPQRRQPVRNLVGANMSFRRQALLDAGGFRHELGRIGKIPAGAEETDLSIRVGQRNPGSEIVYDPEAAVDHFVPAERASFEYFTSRCRGEGRSKAILAALVGGEDGLSEERSYTSRTLPLGFLRGIGDAFRGDVDGLARAATLAVGLATTTQGYLGGQGEAKRIARRREQAEAPERPLRVLMVTPLSPLSQGGVERHVMETSKRIATSGAEVEVLCTEPGGPALSEQVRDGVRIRTVRSWPANRDWCLAPRIWREISRRPWDVIHVQSYHTLVAPLAMLRARTLGIPYVVTFHGGGHSQAHRNKARTTQRRLLRPLLAGAARLVAVASFEIDEYGGELGLGPDHFALIPNGTDLAFAATGAAPRRNGAATIASIGRLERYKGHHRVIEAFPEVLKRKPETTLSVVGSGPYEDDLRRLAEELGVADQVRFTSTPADQPAAMAELLSGISVVVLMSEFETHPLVALEAAAAGCRLLVADASGLGELAREGFARAIPLDENAAEIGRAVVEELGKPPQEKRPNLTSWDECAAELLSLYRSLA